jgi:tripartite-type tricarboxylate transporter receptor subunit TctC
LLFAWSASVHAQSDFPARHLTIVVPYPPGGVVDPVARILGPGLGKELGQPVVIENRAGASGAIGANSVVRAKPDGHTILFHIGVVAAHPTTMKNAGYDVRTDLAPVSLVVTGPYVISANLDLPAKSISELIAYCRSNLRKVFYGSAGIGTLNHLAGELFNAAAGIEMIHVPYKGNGPLIAGLLGGEIQIGMDTIPGSKALAAGGKLRMLAVTSLARNPALPDLPSVTESGVKGFEFALWEAFFLPKGTPEAIVATWQAAIVRVLRDPGVIKQLADYGFEIVGSTPQQLAERVRADIVKYADIIKRAKIVFD